MGVFHGEESEDERSDHSQQGSDQGEDLKGRGGSGGVGESLEGDAEIFRPGADHHQKKVDQQGERKNSHQQKERLENHRRGEHEEDGFFVSPGLEPRLQLLPDRFRKLGKALEQGIGIDPGGQTLVADRHRSADPR